MIVIENEYVNTTPASAAYPYGSAKNVTTPGDTDGTPWELLDINDIQGMMQALVTEGAVVPSGVPETVLASDIFDSLKKIFNRVIVHTDTGGANAYLLTNTAAAKQASAYSDSDVFIFKIANSNTGASTARIGTLAIKSFTEADGSALVRDRLPAGGYATAKYNLTNDRIDLLSVTSAAPTNDIGKGRLWLGAIADIPVNEFICDGAEYSETTYAALFAKVGTTWNTGGETAGFFRVPDFTDRVVLHADADSGGTNDVADTGGSSTHGHTDDFVGANHTHQVLKEGYGEVATSVSGRLSVAGGAQAANSISSGNSGTVPITGGVIAGDNRDSYAAAPWIIKAF